MFYCMDIGHALEVTDKAEQLDISCYTKETLFSTTNNMYEL